MLIKFNKEEEPKEVDRLRIIINGVEFILHLDQDEKKLVIHKDSWAKSGALLVEPHVSNEIFVS
ncbi:hypothetical protein [Pedobacter nutrimenti]|uniref:hypothetical protein n=1 Tax=Pedobacter nutrimenti TaxID=1241337 RepID=UPI00292ED759|nr:hypothetical protein [Pedobacter nutrimenti]